jgi:hypothetical protein
MKHGLRTNYLVILSVGLLSQPVMADVLATTDEGVRVSLKDDGTWMEIEFNPQSSGFDFRKARWGMSREEVEATETLDGGGESEGWLAYAGTVSDLSVHIYYVFVNDQLVRTKYHFVDDHTNDNDYISDYQKLTAILTKKYGAPGEEQVDWRNELYQDNPEKFGFAVSLGHLLLYQTWSTESTQITAQLSGENYKCELAIHYYSTELRAMEEAATSQQQTDDF